ncbi:MAG: four helix bundle protein, partial [candidate division SR1 bacterium]|nr:four helix bundle protein [candidate division SR1 bacterium]
SYQKLEVRKRAMNFVDAMYEITKTFPKMEFALIDQIKRAANSIAANIAEGDQRNTNKENINFLYIAKGSAAEVQTHLLIAQRQGFITKNKSDTLDEEITIILKMLSSLIRYKKTHAKP